MMTEKEWLGYPSQPSYCECGYAIYSKLNMCSKCWAIQRKPVSRLAWVFGISIMLLIAATANAGSGVLSLTQECTVNCPKNITIAPASCVAVGKTSRGTVILTAKHCVDVVTNRFIVYGPNKRKHTAVVVYRHPSLDIAALHVNTVFDGITPVRYTNPSLNSPILLQGVLSERYQKAEGRLYQVDRGRVWTTGMWSHPGMSGAGLYDSDGRLFGIHGSSVTGPKKQTIAAGAQSIRDCIQAVERRYGKVVFANNSIQTQQGTPQVRSSQMGIRANGQMCRKCGDPNCQACNSIRDVDCVPATVAIPRQQVDYERLKREFYAQYGEQLRGRNGANGTNGRDGANGTNGVSPQVDLMQLAQLITSTPEYADRIRGQRGNDGAPGQRGATGATGLTGLTGPAGQNGIDGLVGVPSQKDIRAWLVGSASDPQMAQLLADIVASDPRTQQRLQNQDDFKRRIEALERQQGQLQPPIPDERFSQITASFENQFSALADQVVQEAATTAKASDDQLAVRFAERLADMEKRVVPIIVNYEGKEFASAPNRQAFDPIVINVPAKK